MFYNKEEARRHFNLLSNETHSYLLINSLFVDYKLLSQNEFIILTVKWKKKIKELIEEDDYGFLINGGNILVAVANPRKDKLIEILSTISFTKSNKSSIKTEILELQEGDATMILSMTKPF